MTGGCDDKDKIEEEIPEVSPESPDKFVYVIFPLTHWETMPITTSYWPVFLKRRRKPGSIRCSTPL